MTNEELTLYIANQIKKMREFRNMNQQDLAERLNITKQAVSRYENGQRKANQDVLFELSHIFGCSINDFFPKNEANTKQIETIAAHIDDDVTEEEMQEILDFIEFKKRNRK
ncbi:helix-turn-helix transcriptional regulator [Macrococcus bovicus]|uniref:XRE family transcriptional regulator n=1 Tax=Macrococcus bovicus TaxID=69968 RepID=A0A4R6BWA4_9STAP|nr:helix-turn-helix transcriptional regulator [Macrococcus bovicus]TDM12695.1 XRE family transcriptional regulator [Macrococcus bovicus]